MQNLYIYCKAVFIALVMALLVACHKEETLTNPKTEICLLEQLVDVNNSTLGVFNYDNQNRLISFTRNTDEVFSLVYISDSVAESGNLQPNIASYRNKYLLSADQRLLKTVNENWSPQLGAALITASITETRYMYDAQQNLVEIRTNIGTYYLDSITQKPLSKLVLKPSTKTTFFYDSLGNYNAYRKFFINPDGSEWVTNQEDVIDYQPMELKGAMAVSSLWLPILELSTTIPVGKPFRFGNRTPKTLQTSGFGIQLRSLTFSTDNSGRVIRMEEETNSDFGWPITNVSEFTWRCQ